MAAGAGRGRSKWVRGEYGTGKTFATRFICARARAKRFATTEVQISINDTPLHHLETVYRRMMERLATDAHGEGAFRAVVDAWLYEVGDEVTRLKGIGEDDPQFAALLEARLEEKLAELSTRNPAFSQVLRAYTESVVGRPNEIASVLPEDGVDNFVNFPHGLASERPVDDDEAQGCRGFGAEGLTGGQSGDNVCQRASNAQEVFGLPSAHGTDSGAGRLLRPGAR